MINILLAIFQAAIAGFMVYTISPPMQVVAATVFIVLNIWLAATYVLRLTGDLK
jgi:hypothetical protein